MQVTQNMAIVHNWTESTEGTLEYSRKWKNKSKIKYNTDNCHKVARTTCPKKRLSKILKLSLIRSKWFTSCQTQGCAPKQLHNEKEVAERAMKEKQLTFSLKSPLFLPPLSLRDAQMLLISQKEAVCLNIRHILTLKSGKEEQIKSKKGRREERDRDPILRYDEVPWRNGRVGYTAIRSVIQ